MHFNKLDNIPGSIIMCKRKRKCYESMPGIIIDTFHIAIPGTYEPTNYSYYDGTVEIPDRIYDKDGKCYTVDFMQEELMMQAVKLHSVTVPGNLKYISARAFCNCYHLGRVKLYEGVKGIAEFGFCGCLTLHDIDLPNSLEEIANLAFAYDTNLTNITFGTGLKEMGQEVFIECPHIEVVTCKAVTPPKIHENTFKQKTLDNAVLKVPYESLGTYQKHPLWGKFKTIEFIGPRPKNENNFFEVDGLFYQEMKNGEVYVMPPKEGSYKFEVKKLDIPRHVTYGGRTYTVTGIGKGFLEWQELETLRFVTIPDTVKIICDSAFKSRDLEGVEIPNSVTKIETEAFLGCRNLKKIDIPGSVVTIGDYAFSDECCNLEQLTLHEGLEIIGKGAFSDTTELADLVIPDGVKEIGAWSFHYSGGNRGKRWDTLIIPESVTSIGEGAFEESNVGKVHLPRHLTVVADSLFKGTKLQEVRILWDVVKIGKEAFAKNDNYLQKIYIFQDPDEIEVAEDAFDADAFENAALLVYPERVDAFKAHPYWGRFKDIRSFK